MFAYKVFDYRNIVVGVHEKFPLRVILDERFVLQDESLEIDWVGDDWFTLE